MRKGVTLWGPLEQSPSGDCEGRCVPRVPRSPRGGGRLRGCRGLHLALLVPRGVPPAGAARPLPAPRAARPLPAGVAAPGNKSRLGYLLACTFARLHGLERRFGWELGLSAGFLLHGMGLGCPELAGLCCSGWESEGARTRVEKRGWWCLCPQWAPGDGHGSVEVAELGAL